MPMVRTQALVIRAVDVMETSKVVTLFTRDFGKTTALAKGARRLKSPFHAALDLLSVCDMVLLRKSSETLDLATEGVLVERFSSLRRDLSALYAGYYISELLSELTDLYDPHPKLYDAAIVTLRTLGDESLRERRLLRFELACLRELGFMPELEACVHCGAWIESRSREDSVAFGLATGGVLCRGCRPGHPHVATLSARTLDALRALSTPGSAWRDPAWPPFVLESCRATVAAVLCHLIGRRPRMMSLVGA